MRRGKDAVESQRAADILATALRMSPVPEQVEAALSRSEMPVAELRQVSPDMGVAQRGGVSPELFLGGEQDVRHQAWYFKYYDHHSRPDIVKLEDFGTYFLESIGFLVHEDPFYYHLVQTLTEDDDEFGESISIFKPAVVTMIPLREGGNR